MKSKIPFFQERISILDKQIEKLKSKSSELSALRIVTFVLFVVLFIVFLNVRVFIPSVILSFVFFTGFGLIVRWHNKIKQSLRIHEMMQKINQEEIDRLNFDFDNLNLWAEFADEKHKYSGDLDLYGKNSLFQLLNRAETQTGISLMRNWIENYTDKETIEIRQKTAQELASLVDWRQKIQAHAKRKKTDSKSHEDLIKWLNGKDGIGNKKLFRILPYPVIIISSVLLIAVLYQVIPFFYLLPSLLINGVLLLKTLDYSKSTYESTSSSVKLLESIEKILILIENQQFNQPYLNQLRGGLVKENLKASSKIHKLQKIFDLLNLRGNQVYHIFNLLFLTDFIFLLKAERWRKRYKKEVLVWFDIIGEFEAINSIAAFSFANEKYIFPQIDADGPVLFAKNLGHPLIPANKRVCNDFEIKGEGHVGIVTGSNMSGKSTFLRTVGVNAVLAFAGAPVCADEFESSIFQVFTSMRTKDNLEENISSFYAELLRLKMLLQQINKEKPVLFLLDEILKGTNSTDRHIGAEALAIQLSKSNAFGLISTHDLKLGALQLDAQKLKNYNFSSTIDGQEIIFDYKLRDGICQSTNASQLMAKIGIQIDLST